MKSEMKRIAVVRIRGKKKVNSKIRKTLESMRLHKVNHCVIIKDNPSYTGMLFICKDYVAWGEVAQETVALLLSRRGFAGGKRLRDGMEKNEIEAFAGGFVKGERELKDVGIDPVFRLTPPSKGHGEIKRAAPRGALGKRNMDELLRRMM